jgi:hypothetical protein
MNVASFSSSKFVLASHFSVSLCLHHDQILNRTENKVN